MNHSLGIMIKEKILMQTNERGMKNLARGRTFFIALKS